MSERLRRYIRMLVEREMQDYNALGAYDTGLEQETLPKVGDLLRRVHYPANPPHDPRQRMATIGKDPEVVIGKVYWVSSDGTQVKLQDKYGVKDPKVYDTEGFQKVKTWFKNGV